MPHSPLLTTPFDGTSTASDVLDGVNLSGVNAVVTGASSGLGVETARELAMAGASVTLAVRNVAAGDAVARAIEPSAHVRPRVAHLDLSDISTVDAFADDWDRPLHLLVNNAGLVTGGLERTNSGLELQFAANHLGHHALANRLHGALARGAAERGDARIVALSSTAHMRGGVDFGDINFRRRPYDPQIAYAQAKTANSLFAVEATRRWVDDGITANAVNPGGIATGLQRNFSAAQKASLAEAQAAGIFTYKTVEQGAATTMVAAVSDVFLHEGGHYLDDCQEAYTVPDNASLADHPHGVKEWALDPELAQRLWIVSDQLLGL